MLSLAMLLFIVFQKSKYSVVLYRRPEWPKMPIFASWLLHFLTLLVLDDSMIYYYYFHVSAIAFRGNAL